MPVTVQEYEQIALATPNASLELWCGQVREKPPMTTEHNDVIYRLQRILVLQLDPDEYIVSMDLGRVEISGGQQVIPDVCIIPRAYQRGLLTERPRRLEVYAEPLPLIVEVWSPSTGAYDVTDKLNEYRLRRDAEIWLIHPYDKTLTAWRRQPDGSYTRTVHTEGTIQPAAHPGVTVDIPRLFA